MLQQEVTRVGPVSQRKQVKQATKHQHVKIMTVFEPAYCTTGSFWFFLNVVCSMQKVSLCSWPEYVTQSFLERSVTLQWSQQNKLSRNGMTFIVVWCLLYTLVVWIVCTTQCYLEFSKKCPGNNSEHIPGMKCFQLYNTNIFIRIL